MCPTDTTPDPRDMLRAPESKEIPQPVPDDGHRAPRTQAPLDMAQRPPLPEHPELMAADVEDEEADPVVDDGPGIADGAARRR